MKTDGLLAGNLLKGSDGNAIHAVLCGAGHNLRLILVHLWVLLLAMMAMLLFGPYNGPALQRRLRSAA
jgi:transposase, IS5 family